MWGICLAICVRQPQIKINPFLQEIVKGELCKLPTVGFIYPIYNSRWVSSLVFVTKKSGKWWICVGYRALIKFIEKDHFPLPFIDQILDKLVGK